VLVAFVSKHFRNIGEKPGKGLARNPRGGMETKSVGVKRSSSVGPQHDQAANVARSVRSHGSREGGTFPPAGLGVASCRITRGKVATNDRDVPVLSACGAIRRSRGITPCAARTGRGTGGVLVLQRLHVFSLQLGQLGLQRLRLGLFLVVGQVLAFESRNLLFHFLDLLLQVVDGVA